MALNYVPTDTAHLVRDPHSKALVVTDVVGLQTSRARRKMVTEQKQQTTFILERLNALELQVETLQLQLDVLNQRSRH